jgi:hypothetical protein
VERRPTIAVVLNGKIVDRLKMTGTDVAYPDYHVVPGPSGQSNMLELSIDSTAMEDGQDRGLRLRFLSWGPG